MKPKHLHEAGESANARSVALFVVTVLALMASPLSLADEPQTIQWTRHSPQTAADTPRGYLEYQDSCSVCHGPMPERPGTRALAAKYKGALPAMLEDRRDLTPEFIRAIVRGGITVMPQFRKTELSDAQLDAIIAYLTRPRS